MIASVVAVICIVVMLVFVWIKAGWGYAVIILCGLWGTVCLSRLVFLLYYKHTDASVTESVLSFLMMAFLLWAVIFVALHTGSYIPSIICLLCAAILRIVAHVVHWQTSKTEAQQRNQTAPPPRPVIDTENSLYWIYDPEDHRLSGPVNKQQICQMYVSREIFGNVKIRNALAKGSHDDYWCDIYLPPLYPMDVISLLAVEDLSPTKVTEMKASFMRLFPALYTALQQQISDFRGRTKEIEIPPLPIQNRYEYTGKNKILQLVSFVCSALLLLANMALISGVWVFCEYWKLCYPKSWRSFLKLRLKSPYKVMFLLHEQKLARREIRKAVCVDLCLFCVQIIGTCIIILYVWLLSEFSVVQSWTIVFLSWSFFHALFVFLESYARINGNMTLMKILQAIALWINGINVANTFDYYVQTCHLTLMSLLPACICGFIANYLLQERFLLKCSQNAPVSDICFHEGVGCCDVVSSHNFATSYLFIGASISNILLVFATIRLCAWIVTFENALLKSLSDRES